jgi:hypothetical protein
MGVHCAGMVIFRTVPPITDMNSHQQPARAWDLCFLPFARRPYRSSLQSRVSCVFEKKKILKLEAGYGQR